MGVKSGAFFPFTGLQHGDRIELKEYDQKTITLDIVYIGDPEEGISPCCVLEDFNDDLIQMVQLIGWELDRPEPLGWTPFRSKGMHPAQGRLVYKILGSDYSGGNYVTMHASSCRIFRGKERRLIFEKHEHESAIHS